MDLSLAGLIGAFVGTVLAWINYYLVVGFVTQRLRALDKSQTPATTTTMTSVIGRKTFQPSRINWS